MCLLRSILMLMTALCFSLGCDEGDGGGGTDEDTETEKARDPNADVCNFTEPVTLGEPEEDGMVLVLPNHPDIRYFGRIDCSEPTAPLFAFPGVSIRAKFNGDAVDMVLSDHGGTSDTSTNFYNVIIDDEEPVVLEMTPGENVYILAENLEPGEHTVEVFKRIESNGGSGEAEFLGFRIPDGAEMLPLLPRPHRLELIGDSITCGYGNELSTTDPDSYHYTTVNSNAYNAWGAIAARILDAEYMAVAYSGRGVYRNYEGDSSKTLPEMYLDTLPDSASSAAWEVSQFTPEVLVINLGTNDFSLGIDDVEAATETFELAYLEFVETLRGYYPDATFLLAVGPMLSDDYPGGYLALTNVTESLEAVVAARAADGDEDVHMLYLPEQSSPFGEDWHPTVATHMDMAGRLVDRIDELSLMAQ